jgi:hypothetical protein
MGDEFRFCDYCEDEDIVRQGVEGRQIPFFRLCAGKEHSPKKYNTDSKQCLGYNRDNVEILLVRVTVFRSAVIDRK